MAIFKDRLLTALSVRNMSAAELSRLSGIDEATLSNYKKGKYIPKQRKTEAIANALDVSVSWLMGADTPIETKVKTNITGVRIPVLGYVRAGIPIEAIEEILDYEEISQDMAKQGEYFALSIKGDSMEPKISEGDVVIVRRQEIVENGELAVVLVNGNDATVKKFYKNDNGITLISTNPAYDPFTYTKKEVNDLPVRVIGKVVELRAKF